MAKEKKSFVLYNDQLELFNALSNEQAGELIKHIFQFINNNEIELNDPLLKIAFVPIKQQLIRDLEKYQNVVERNRLNGQKGGRPNKPKKPNGLIGNPKEPKKPDNDNDNDNDNGNELLNNSFGIFWNIYDKKTDKIKCLKVWKSINKHKHAFIYEQARKYVKSTPDPKFRKNPLTWLNGNCWEDETGDNNTTKKYIPTK